MKSQVKLSKFLPVLQPEIQEAVLRIVRDPDRAYLFRKGITKSPTGLKPGSRTAIQYVSTRDVDRDGEILDPDGAMLDEFRKAPVILWGHNYSEPPIGSDKRIDSDGYGLIAESIYATTERAKEVFKLKQEGHLKTQSVGFVPLERIERGERGWTRAWQDRAERWGVDHMHFENAKAIISRWLLLEHSDVSVPSNINALQIAVSKGLTVSPRLLEELGVAPKRWRIMTAVRVETESERVSRIVAEVFDTLRGRV